MVGGPLDEAIKLACAGELVHLATLLHDDVIDEGTLRRGVAAPRVVWSNSASVLGGDYALTRALDLVGSVRPREPLSEAIETLRLLVEGEMLQLQHRRSPDPSESAYLDVARRKTASLFRWCCRAGIHLRPDPDALRAMTTFGESLGLCFQVVDDILDMEADPAVSGKRLWLDLAGGKATLPVLLAMQRSEEVRALWQELVTLQASGAADEPLAAKLTARIVSATREAGGIDAARLRARELGERASSALAGAPAGPERTALERIAVELVARVR
jgi:octaprenyl-diphosphate synthase